MDKHDYDVIIVGAGPVGGRATPSFLNVDYASLCSRNTMKSDDRFQCAGLVTPSAMHVVEAYETVLEEVDGALIRTKRHVGTGWNRRNPSDLCGLSKTVRSIRCPTRHGGGRTSLARHCSN